MTLYDGPLGDIVEQGPADRPRRGWPRLVAVVLLLVLVPGWLVDRQLRAHQSHALATCVGGALDDVTYAERQIGAMASYLAPTLAQDISPQVRDGLYVNIARVAQRQVGPVSRQLAACGDVSISPWHLTLRNEHTTVMRYLQVEHDRLLTMTADGSALTDSDAVRIRLTSAVNAIDRTLRRPHA